MTNTPFCLIGLFFWFIHLQPILKGLPGDADYAADTAWLEQSGTGHFIDCNVADIV